MPAEALVIDADGHILEPPDLWEKYLDPKYRERAMRIRVAEDGYEYLEIDQKHARLTQPGVLGSLGGMGKNVNEAKQLRESMMTGKIRPEDARAMRPRPEQTYMKGAAFGTMNAKERIELIDKEGMAKALLYPTIGLLWEAELFDPELSAAYCTAYNRWIADFCRDTGGRLVPIAHLSLGDPEAAAKEFERAVKDGCKGAFVAPFTITRKPHGHPDHDARCSRPRRISMCRWRFIRPWSRSHSAFIIASTNSAGPHGITICSPRRAASMRWAPSSSTACSIDFPR